MIALILFVYTLIATIAVILYFPKVLGFRYGFKKVARKRAIDKRKISIVIPARNESAVIGDLLKSIKAQDYDVNFFEVNVIVKEENDPTVELAQSMGAEVCVVPNQTCKGEALKAFFDTVMKKQSKCDAYIIIDADAVLAPSFLTELNNSLEYEEYDIIITRKCAKNFLGSKRNRSLFSNCSALTYPIVDDLGNRYRMHKDMPLNMCGQGLMVRTRVIEALGGWPYTTLTEDYELKLDSLLHGFKSMLYPYAVLYTEEALGHKENLIRRTRWLTGYKQCDKMYKKRIKEQIKQRGSINRGEREYLYGIFPVLLFAADTFAAVASGACLTVWYAAMQSALWRQSLKMLVLIPLGVMYGLLFLYGALASTFWIGMDKRLSLFEWITTLLFNPIYLIEYIPIYLKGCIYSATNKAPEWEQTQRTNYDDVVFTTDEYNEK